MTSSDETKAGIAPVAAVEAPADNAAAPLSALDDHRDYADPMTWQVPVICKDCNQSFEVPYRHFQAGVVFHCPHCHGSFVPTSTMYRVVHAAFEAFFARQRAARAIPPPSSS